VIAQDGHNFSGDEFGFTRLEISSASASARLQPSLHHVPGATQPAMHPTGPLPQQPPWAARTGDAVVENPFPALAVPETQSGNRTSAAWRACLANCCNLETAGNQKRVTHCPQRRRVRILPLTSRLCAAWAPQPSPTACHALCSAQNVGVGVPLLLSRGNVPEQTVAGTAPSNPSNPGGRHRLCLGRP